MSIIPVWTPPTSVVEAIERCTAHAEQEDRWLRRKWVEGIEPGPNGTYEEITDEEWTAACGSVGGCMAGIIAVQCLDGKALKMYYTGERHISDVMLEDEFTMRVCRTTALAIRAITTRTPAEAWYVPVKGAISSYVIDTITGFNDKQYSIEPIVTAFRTARELGERFSFN